MTTVAELNAARKEAGLPLIRFHIRRLRPADIQELRDAFAAMYEISATAIGDRRGYLALARGHGYDQDLCHTDSRVFLTWHRAYIYVFEKALNSALQWKRNNPTLELTLPYWDWTQFDATTDAANGIPRALDDATYVDGSGQTIENPLARAFSLYRQLNQGLSGNDVFTARYPSGLLAAIPELADDVERNLDNPSFMGFSNDLNFGAHGAIHVEVGGIDAQSALPGQTGDMRQVVSAAYDPIFWFHHSMVDKVWFDWQTRNPTAAIPQHVLDTVVYGGMLGSDLIDAQESLRYTYFDGDVESTIEVGGTEHKPDTSPLADDSASDVGSAGPPTPPTPPPPSEIYLGTVRGPFKRAQLDFHRLRPPKQSYEIRAFVNNPTVDHTTPKSDPSYIGRLVLFGHGQCHGARGHCNPTLETRDAYDLRPKHPLRYQKTRYCIDVTRGLRRLLGSQTAVDDVKVYLVTVGPSGTSVPAQSVRYQGVSLSTLV